MTVDLTSDTATQPTPGMIEAMFAAVVGDDVFRKDPTVNELERFAADLFGMEAALFCPSGTMTNQLAIKCHTQPLDEVICEEKSHIYQYEGGVYSLLSSVSMHLVQGDRGKILPGQISAAVKEARDWLPRSRLVVLENTCNRGGGTIYSIDEVHILAEETRRHGLSLHLDGARLFNALVETGETCRQWGQTFDTISICLSKGLGAPVGSLLLGSEKLMATARRYRKVFGGGMRQAGYIAAAGLYALQHQVERLADDNARARSLGNHLRSLPYVKSVADSQTNICLFDLAEGTAVEFLEKMEAVGILGTPFGPQTVRLTTHLGVNDEQISYVKDQLARLAR